MVHRYSRMQLLSATCLLFLVFALGRFSNQRSDDDRRRETEVGEYPRAVGRHFLSSWSSKALELSEQHLKDQPYRVGLRHWSGARGSRFLKPMWMALPYRIGVTAGNLQEAIWEDPTDASEGNLPGVIEATVAAAIFANVCSDEGLMLDLGANTGLYSLLALSHGCRTITVDPNNEVQHFFRLSTMLNGFGPERFTQVKAMITNDTEAIFDGWNVRVGHGHKPNSGRQSKTMLQGHVQIDDLVSQDVTYMKLDVEGHEPHAFASAKRLFAQHVVKYVYVEVTFYMESKENAGYDEIFLSLVQKLGYAPYHLRCGGGPEEVDGRVMNKVDARAAPLPKTYTEFMQWYSKTTVATCNREVQTFCALDLIFVHPSAPAIPSAVVDV